ncbi:MAG: hypothetical protein JW836_16675 [Deltaproteobacteria bacterium]|nr:hypothetical protein [Deltaproteobacteria bacterium]
MSRIIMKGRRERILDRGSCERISRGDEESDADFVLSDLVGPVAITN